MRAFFSTIAMAARTIANTLSWRDALDIIILTYLFYTVINLLKHTRTGVLFKGLALLAGAYVIATMLKLKTIIFIIDYLLRYGLIVLVVVFQPELRSVLENIGRTRFGRSVFAGKLGEDERSRVIDALEEICSAAESMSRSKTGALIVFERDTNLSDIVATGTKLGAEVSMELIGNIFYTGAPLHDGAVVVSKDKIVAAGCLLPVSHNNEISRDMGTRHRAALGITENSDAVVLVVSEETGIISIAQNGIIIRRLDRAGALRILSRELAPAPAKQSENLKFGDRIKKLFKCFSKEADSK